MAQDLPPLEQKDSYKVGFAQTESNNPWRIAQTKSFQDTAAACGWDLVMTDAGGSAAKQVAEENGVGLGKLAAPLRAALAGRTATPSVFDMMTALGREESLARLQDQTDFAG